MKKTNREALFQKELKNFYILWSTQALSQLGSSMTAFALMLFVFEKTGSALQTALLSICSYAPYVCMSIFAGALSDRWNKKKVMLICDTLAAGSTLLVLLLLKTGNLTPLVIYLLNALNGLMNTVQQPASDVAMTLITPKKYFQKTSGMRSFSQSLNTILHPVIATVLFAFGGMDAVIAVDVFTFVMAFLALLFFVKIPEVFVDTKEQREPLLVSVKAAIGYLKQNPLILNLILFLAGVNLVASAFDATLPALVLPRANGGDKVLSVVMSCAGIATLIGSLIVTLLPAPRNRVKVICLTMLLSLSTENFMLALCRTPVAWCISQVVGWLPVPFMGANMDVILRSTIPPGMQGRVYSCRNTLQFFTIPLGFFFGGFLVDNACEPFMATDAPALFHILFGTGKGSGAAMMMLLLGFFGTGICLVFGQILKKYRFEEPETVENQRKTAI